jgi:hypothetical protein
MYVAVRDMKGTKPCKPLYLFLVGEGDLENVLTNLMAFSGKIFYRYEPLQLRYDARDRELPSCD